MTIADTDVVIDFLAGRNPGADQVAGELNQGSLGTTVITRFELLSGAKSVRQEKAIKQFLEAIFVFPLDEGAADLAARIRLSLEKQGNVIGMGDSLIAGIVLSHNGVLLTRNRRHFQLVESLRLW